jgi:hypothetical protein
MGEKLLKREGLPDQSAQGQDLDGVRFQQDLHAAKPRIQMEDHLPSDELRGDILAFEIHADHAMSIHGCRSRCSPSRAVSQLSGSMMAGSAGKDARWGKAVRGG